MGKSEFIQQLRRSLSSINDYTFVNDTISYYENYIESQIRMGKTEEEVMRQLGDPRLIAKSICATREENEKEEFAKDSSNGYTDASNQKGAYTILNLNGRQMRMPSWVMKILTIVIVALVLILLFTILSWLAPFIVMGAVAYLIYKLLFVRNG